MMFNNHMTKAISIQKRLPYFDFLRGLAIVMVVGIHTFNTNASNGISIPLRTLICCAVPLFVALSAFFVSQKDFQNSSFWKWFLKQTKKIYIPMLLWSIPYLLISLYDSTFSPIRAIIYFFMGGFSIYYFISFIIQGYLFLPFLLKIEKIRYVIFLNLLWITVFVYFQNIRGWTFPLLYSGTPFPMWMMFFCLGIKIAKSNRLYKINGYLLGFVVFWIIAILATYWYISNYGRGYGIKPSTHIMSAFLIILLFSRDVELWFNQHFGKNPFYMLLCKIGKDSFGIYLIHCFVIAYILPFFGIKEYWILSWLLVLFLTWLFCLSIKIILPNSIARYLGVF